MQKKTVTKISKQFIKVLFPVGIGLLISSLILINFHFIAFLLMIFGYLSLIFFFILKYRKKLSKLVFLFVIFIGYLVLEFLLVYIFSTVPVMATRKKYVDFDIYNALFYRVWDCSGSRKINYFYNSGFYCSHTNLEEMDINFVLTEVEDNYKKYKNKYINVTGKISMIDSITSLEMRPYETISGALNGYVSFDSGLSLVCEFKDEELSNFSLYDEAILTGRIVDLKNKKDEKILRMKDCKIHEMSNYDTYNLDVTAKNKCIDYEPTEYLATLDNTYSTICIDKILVRYNKTDVYELNYVLKENKLTIDDLLKDASSNEEFDTAWVYHYSDMNVIKCKTENPDKAEYFIEDSKVNKTIDYCGK